MWGKRWGGNICGGGKVGGKRMCGGEGGRERKCATCMHKSSHLGRYIQFTPGQVHTVHTWAGTYSSHLGRCIVILLRFGGCTAPLLHPSLGSGGGPPFGTLAGDSLMEGGGMGK